MKMNTLILSALVILPLTSQAKNDWTPILRPMLNGCDFTNQIDKKSKLYKASVLKDTLVIEDENEEESPTHQTILLKDAVAFGQPFTKITDDGSDGAFAYTIYFKNKDFIKLRPLFKLPKVDSYNKHEIKINNLGYDTPARTLTFNIKEKTITCSGYEG